MTNDPHLDHALPGWAVDAIADGVPDPGRGARNAYGKCVSIAMSAYFRGWTESQYVDGIAHPQSKLWAQIGTRSDGRPQPEATAFRQLRKAWADGSKKAATLDPRTRDEIASDAVERAYAWSDRIADHLDNLSAEEAAVIQYVIDQTEQRGMLKVTCPGRAVAEAAKMPHRRAARILGKLADRGMLIQHSRGRRGEAGTGKAAIYELPDPWELAHSKTGSNPMCHSEPSQTVQAEAPAEELAKVYELKSADVAHRVTPGDVAHRVTPDPETHFSPTAVDVFLFDVSDNCGIDVDDMTPVETTYCAWAYEHAGDAKTVAEGILDARAAAEVVRRAGDDPTGMSIVELLSVHSECGDAEADPVETYRAMSA